MGGLLTGGEPVRRLEELHEDSIDNITSDMVNAGFITYRQNEKTGMVEEWIRDAIARNNEKTGYKHIEGLRSILEVAEEVERQTSEIRNNRSEVSEYQGPEAEEWGRDYYIKTFNRLVNQFPEALEAALKVKDVRYPEGGGDSYSYYRRDVKSIVKEAQKAGLTSVQDLPDPTAGGLGSDAGPSQPGAQEQPTGPRKRCPRGSRKAPKSGQCTPHHGGN